MRKIGFISIVSILLVFFLSCEPINPTSEKFGYADVDFDGQWELNGVIEFADGSSEEHSFDSYGHADWYLNNVSVGSEIKSIDLTFSKETYDTSESYYNPKEAKVEIVYKDYRVTKDFTDNAVNFSEQF